MIALSSPNFRSPASGSKSVMRRRDVVLGVRPVGMAGDLRLLPRRQPGIDVGELVARLALERCDLVGDRDAVGAVSSRRSSWIWPSRSETGFSKSR